MATAPSPVKSFPAVFVDGASEAIARNSDRRYFVHHVVLVKTGAVGGAGDTMTVAINLVTTAFFDLNGVATGTVVVDTTLVGTVIEAGQLVSFQPAVGAGDNGCRVFLDVVSAD